MDERSWTPHPGHPSGWHPQLKCQMLIVWTPKITFLLSVHTKALPLLSSIQTHNVSAPLQWQQCVYTQSRPTMCWATLTPKQVVVPRTLHNKALFHKQALAKLQEPKVNHSAIRGTIRNRHTNGCSIKKLDQRDTLNVHCNAHDSSSLRKLSSVSAELSSLPRFAIQL